MISNCFIYKDKTFLFQMKTSSNNDPSYANINNN